MRPHEHAAAKASNLLTGLIEFVHRVGLCAEAAWRSAWRASIGGPYGLAVAVDGHAVGAAPRPALRLLGPIPDDAIGIGATVDGRNFVRLSGASARLRLNARSVHREQDGDQRHQRE